MTGYVDLTREQEAALRYIRTNSGKVQVRDLHRSAIAAENMAQALVRMNKIKRQVIGGVKTVADVLTIA